MDVVCTTFISKQIFCGEVEQNNTLSKRVARPQSTQTLEIFEKFLSYLRETTGDTDIHPRQVGVTMDQSFGVTSW